MSYYQAKRTAMAKLYLEQRAAQEQRVGPQDNLLERSRVWLGRYLAQPRQSQIDWRPRFAFTPPKDVDHGDTRGSPIHSDDQFGGSYPLDGGNERLAGQPPRNTEGGESLRNVHSGGQAADQGTEKGQVNGHPEIIDCEYSVVEDSFAPVSEGEKPEEAGGAAQGSTEHAEG